MSDVRIHGYLVSTWTRTACMACIEKGVGYELVPVVYGGEEHALHPFARIPVLEHDGRTITEGLAITGYIDEVFGGPALQPPDPAARTAMREWMSRCADYGFRDIVRLIPRGRAAGNDELRVARSVLERFDRLIDPAAYLAGQAITLADLYLAPQVSNAREKVPELLDALGAWFERMAARESFLRTSYDPASL